ncbi:hypothetical protein KO02_12345 [Sphingobacterium sp. ML3W]|uniref:hypothetical protein n=1 Tax=Sphingobacterium sp. ML3W TaxID=1538644 RepID=UPI0004F62EBB|nr:hypothetical protein [Sphingobacterium sp. ML3W]AIM37393.1 hypothetical protein KO02_12345 [Sphingobacterium sp. ML3W]
MDFSKQRYNVEQAFKSGKTMMEVYPELGNYEEFSKSEQDPILMIMILMVDEDSPFVKAYRDNVEMRLQKIYQYLGLETYDSMFIEINEGHNFVFNNMVFKWFMLSDSLAYETWYSMQINYHINNLFLRRPLDFDNNPEKNMDTRAKIRKELPASHKELVEFERVVFPDTFSRKIVKEQVAKNYTPPEQFAQKKEDEFGNVRVI